MPSDSAARVTIWTDAEHVPQIERVLKLMDGAIVPIGVGGPRVAPVNEFARRLGTGHEDDLRKLLVECPADYLLLGSTMGVSPEEILAANWHHSTVLTLEPIASELSDLVGAKARAGTVPSRSSRISQAIQPAQDRVIWTPAFSRCPGWAAAAEPEQVIGRPQMIGVSSFGQPNDCSLFARLFDAWQLVLDVCQLPETIDASLTGPLGKVPDDLRGLTGHLAAHGRLASGCTAVLSVSDRSGRVGRQVDVIGDQGHLRATDHSYWLCDATGQCIDQQSSPDPAGDLADLIARDWQVILAHRADSTPSAAPGRPEPTDRLILGCCLTCLLSARTGNPESPSRMLQLSR